MQTAAIPHTAYIILTSHELPGELFVKVAEKNNFKEEQQALVSLMQRMLVLMLSDNYGLPAYDEEAITNLTRIFCIKLKKILISTKNECAQIPG